MKSAVGDEATDGSSRTLHGRVCMLVERVVVAR
jgi:hypothetical protein